MYDDLINQTISYFDNIVQNLLLPIYTYLKTDIILSTFLAILMTLELISLIGKSFSFFRKRKVKYTYMINKESFIYN